MGHFFSPECIGTPAITPAASTIVRTRDVHHFAILERLYRTRKAIVKTNGWQETSSRQPSAFPNEDQDAATASS
jgi:hypothetical protein